MVERVTEVTTHRKYVVGDMSTVTNTLKGQLAAQPPNSQAGEARTGRRQSIDWAVEVVLCAYWRSICMHECYLGLPAPIDNGAELQGALQMTQHVPPSVQVYTVWLWTVTGLATAIWPSAVEVQLQTSTENTS